jgi:hypothetical protein
MEKDGKVATLPNPHSRRSDIGEPLLKKILAAADITAKDWTADPRRKQDVEGSEDSDRNSDPDNA